MDYSAKKWDQARKESLVDREVALVVLDLSSVTSYLLAQPLIWLAEERQGAVWLPLTDGPTALDLDLGAARRAAEERQLALHWPPRHPSPVPAAMRVAALACACGLGGQVMSGMTRLAFGGAADLEDRAYQLLATEDSELAPEQVLRAAQPDSEWDTALIRIAGELGRVGVSSAPALRWKGKLYSGIRAITAIVAEHERPSSADIAEQARSSQAG